MSGSDTNAPHLNWGRLSTAQRDAAYDNAAATHNSAALSQARNEASAAFRAAHSKHLDLAYGPRERNKWDLYPAADSKAPVLVFIHGGYWQRNSREFFAIMAEGALARGFAAALPSHTLAPEASLTEIVAHWRRFLDDPDSYLRHLR